MGTNPDEQPWALINSGKYSLALINSEEYSWTVNSGGTHER